MNIIERIKQEIEKQNRIACCFTGPRSQKLPWGFNEQDKRCLNVKDMTREEIVKAIKEGYSVFMSVMAIGFDMICAEIVLELKKQYPKIKLYCIIPCKGQEKVWSKELQIRYHNILRKADKVNVLYNTYSRECMLNRNKYMVNNSAKLIALYGGSGGGTKFTIDYAKEQGLDVIILTP